MKTTQIFTQHSSLKGCICFHLQSLMDNTEYIFWTCSTSVVLRGVTNCLNSQWRYIIAEVMFTFYLMHESKVNSCVLPSYQIFIFFMEKNEPPLF